MSFVFIPKLPIYIQIIWMFFLEYIMRLTYTKGFCNIYYLQQSEQGTFTNKKYNNTKPKRSYRGKPTNKNPSTARSKAVVEAHLRTKILTQQN